MTLTLPRRPPLGALCQDVGGAPANGFTKESFQTLLTEHRDEVTVAEASTKKLRGWKVFKEYLGVDDLAASPAGGSKVGKKRSRTESQVSDFLESKSGVQ